MQADGGADVAAGGGHQAAFAGDERAIHACDGALHPEDGVFAERDDVADVQAGALRDMDGLVDDGAAADEAVIADGDGADAAVFEQREDILRPRRDGVGKEAVQIGRGVLLRRLRRGGLRRRGQGGGHGHVLPAAGDERQREDEQRGCRRGKARIEPPRGSFAAARGVRPRFRGSARLFLLFSAGIEILRLLRRAAILSEREHALVEGRVQLFHVLEALMLLYPHAAQQRALLLFRQVHAQAARADEVVVQQAVERLRRRFAREAVVDGGRKAVDIRPGALALVLVLLDGRVAVLERDGHGLVALGRFARAAEVQQPHGPALQHQVVGADVAVDEPRGVHRAERGKERLDHVQQLAGGDAPAALRHEFLECRAVNVLHDDIDGVVGLEKVAHGDDLRLFVHFCHRPRLIEEAPAALVVVPLRARVAVHLLRDVRVARDPGGGKIFLDGDLQLQLQVAADVGDAEAALPQHAAHEIALHEHGAGRQVVRHGHIRARGEAAAGAGALLAEAAHAVWAVFIPPVHAPRLPSLRHMFSLYLFLRVCSSAFTRRWRCSRYNTCRPRRQTWPRRRRRSSR